MYPILTIQVMLTPAQYPRKDQRINDPLCRITRKRTMYYKCITTSIANNDWGTEGENCIEGGGLEGGYCVYHLTWPAVLLNLK